MSESTITKLSEPQVRCLMILERQHNHVPAQTVAKAMWPDSPSWKHYYNSGGHGAPMRMKAGALLYRLKERGGFVLQTHTKHQAMWAISERGRRALDEVRRNAAWDDGDETP